MYLNYILYIYIYTHSYIHIYIIRYKWNIFCETLRFDNRRSKTEVLLVITHTHTDPSPLAACRVFQRTAKHQSTSPLFLHHYPWVILIFYQASVTPYHWMARRGIKVENIVNREMRFSHTYTYTPSRTFMCDVSDRRPSPTWVSIGKCQGIPWITPRSKKGEREREREKRIERRKTEGKKQREHLIHTQEEISNLIGDISHAGKMSGEISPDRCALPRRGRDRGVDRVPR